MMSKIVFTVFLAGVIGLALSGEAPIAPAVHEPVEPSVTVLQPEPTPVNPCLENGGKMVGEDCKSYMECVDGKWTKEKCGWGKFYNAEKKGCEYNWFYKHCSL